jgi:hypothetical protein
VRPSPTRGAIIGQRLGHHTATLLRLGPQLRERRSGLRAQVLRPASRRPGRMGKVEGGCRSPSATLAGWPQR